MEGILLEWQVEYVVDGFKIKLKDTAVLYYFVKKLKFQNHLLDIRNSKPSS